MKCRPRLLSSLITLQFDVPKRCHLITFPNEWEVKNLSFGFSHIWFVIQEVKAGLTSCVFALWYQEVETLFLLFRQRLETF